MKKTLLLLVSFAALGMAQFYSAPGASSGGSTKGASLPGTCVEGTLFFDTTAGANFGLNQCTAANTWAVIAGGASIAWGAVTGTLGSQSDLVSALSAKVGSSTTVNGHALSGNVTVTPTDLSLLIGTNTEAWSATLDSWAGKAVPSGVAVGTTDTQSLTNKTVDGVAPATVAFLDATSSVQTQLSGKVGTATTVNGHALSGNVTVTPTDLSLLIGTNTEAWSAVLDSWAGKTVPTGAAVGTTDTQSLTNKTVDGVAPATVAFLDATSSVQTQLGGKVGTATTVNGHALSGNVTVTPTDLSLLVGTNTEAWSTVLDAWAGKAVPTGTPVGTTDTQTLTNKSIATTQLTGTLQAGQEPAHTGDMTNTAGSVATNVGAINGTTVPASAGVLGTNGSSQPVAATAHGVGGPLVCISSGANTTTYTCSTTPTFTPAAGDTIIWQADVTNTGTSTLNVNSLGAKALKHNSGSLNMAVGDILTTAWYLITYDGTNWVSYTQGSTTGNGKAVFQLNPIISGTLTAPLYASATNCSSTASPAVCVAAPAGKVQVAASATTLQINTTAVTASSEIGLSYSTVGITAPADIATMIPPYVSAISAGSSFTITLPVAPTTNPVNVFYYIIN